MYPYKRGYSCAKRYADPACTRSGKRRLMSAFPALCLRLSRLASGTQAYHIGKGPVEVDSISVAERAGRCRTRPPFTTALGLTPVGRFARTGARLRPVPVTACRCVRGEPRGRRRVWLRRRPACSAPVTSAGKAAFSAGWLRELAAAVTRPASSSRVGPGATGGRQPAA